MQRTVAIHLKDVHNVPQSLRADPTANRACLDTEVNLARLFHHYYLDSFPAGPPKPDPSRFEYLELIAPGDWFRFLRHVSEASTVKKRGISIDLGQAFCRWMLHEHFGIRYFAHMSDVLDKDTHAAFEGMKVCRIAKGDVPDYLCARRVDRPLIAEAKGRFDSIGFGTAEFEQWRRQFDRIVVKSRNNLPLRVKGYIVATRFTSEKNSANKRTTVYTEDPETSGEEPLRDESESAVHLGRVAAALHYAGIFRKLNLPAIASALELGYALDERLFFQAPEWTCMTQPMQGIHFIGGFYRTAPGVLPSLNERGWVPSFELGSGHAVFVGLASSVATEVVRAARGDWAALDSLEVPNVIGRWSSDFSWLDDGTVIAPVEQFLPTSVITL